MKITVRVKRRVLKGIKKMPAKEQERLAFLIKSLTEDGPVQPSWPNYSNLSITEYHCRLS
jgi:mRNA-degrading endonuclease RelE of RelBE toxin-antitoxin system